MSQKVQIRAISINPPLLYTLQAYLPHWELWNFEIQITKELIEGLLLYAWNAQ